MNQPAHRTSEEPPLRIGYLRGLRYREELMAAGRPVRCERCRTWLKGAVRLLALSRIDPGFRIADALAQEYGTDRKQMREDCHFAAAVDTIALYCGDEARTLILGGHRLLGRKTVMQISRTAPARQRFEMEQVRSGRRPLETRGVSDPVFDTVDFKEVISRLRRTQGKLGVCLRALEEMPEEVRPAQSERAAIRERLASITENTRLLLTAMRTAPEGRPCPCDLRRGRKVEPGERSAGEMPASYREIMGLLGQAQSWPKKCVRDWDVLLRRVRPIAAEKGEVRRQGRLVVDRAAQLRRSLAQR